jgi:hypothetical protein
LKILDFQRGFECETGGLPNKAELALWYKDKRIYRYRIQDKGKVKESKKLEKLVLEPGTYTIRVEGGIGTFAILRYVVKPE